jgi:hypothetical protein
LDRSRQIASKRSYPIDLDHEVSLYRLFSNDQFLLISGLTCHCGYHGLAATAASLHKGVTTEEDCLIMIIGLINAAFVLASPQFQNAGSLVVQYSGAKQQAQTPTQQQPVQPPVVQTQEQRAPKPAGPAITSTVAAPSAGTSPAAPKIEVPPNNSGTQNKGISGAKTPCASTKTAAVAPGGYQATPAATPIAYKTPPAVAPSAYQTTAAIKPVGTQPAVSAYDVLASSSLDNSRGMLMLVSLSLFLF